MSVAAAHQVAYLPIPRLGYEETTVENNHRIEA